MNIIVVEDSPVMQQMLLATLAQVQGLDVVGIATGEAEAIALIVSLRPELVLLDMFLTPGHGLKVLQAVRHAGVHCRVLVLSNESLHAEYRRRGEALGVLAFLDKGDGLEGLFATLANVVSTG